MSTMHSMFRLSLRLAKALEAHAAAHRRLVRIESRTPTEARAYQESKAFLTKMLKAFMTTAAFKSAERARSDNSVLIAFEDTKRLLRSCARHLRELRMNDHSKDDEVLVDDVLRGAHTERNVLFWEVGWNATADELLAFARRDCHGKFDVASAARRVVRACPPADAPDLTPKAIEKKVTAARKLARSAPRNARPG